MEYTTTTKQRLLYKFTYKYPAAIFLMIFTIKIRHPLYNSCSSNNISFGSVEYFNRTCLTNHHKKTYLKIYLEDACRALHRYIFYRSLCLIINGILG